MKEFISFGVGIALKRTPYLIVLFSVALAASLIYGGFAYAASIQGEKVDAQGNLFTGQSTISIRTPSQSWYGPSYSASTNPFFFTGLAAGTYEIGIQVPDGYSASYSICTNCILHPASSFVPY